MPLFSTCQVFVKTSAGVMGVLSGMLISRTNFSRRQDGVGETESVACVAAAELVGSSVFVPVLVGSASDVLVRPCAKLLQPCVWMSPTSIVGY